MTNIVWRQTVHQHRTYSMDGSLVSFISMQRKEKKTENSVSDWEIYKTKYSINIQHSHTLRNARLLYRTRYFLFRTKNVMLCEKCASIERQRGLNYIHIGLVDIVVCTEHTIEWVCAVLFDARYGIGRKMKQLAFWHFAFHVHTQQNLVQKVLKTTIASLSANIWFLSINGQNKIIREKGICTWAI